jgi:hypothetical protein
MTKMSVMSIVASVLVGRTIKCVELMS